MARDMTMGVELRKHIGVRYTLAGEIEEEHDQWIVIATAGGRDPFQLGYLNKRDGAKLAWLPDVPPQLGKALCEKFESLAAEARAKLLGVAVPQPEPATVEESK